VREKAANELVLAGKLRRCLRGGVVSQAAQTKPMSEQLFEGEAIASGIGRLAIPAAEGISGWTMNVPYRVGKAGEVKLSDNLAGR
jgi:hypothetical protein